MNISGGFINVCNFVKISFTSLITIFVFVFGVCDIAATGANVVSEAVVSEEVPCAAVAVAIIGANVVVCGIIIVDEKRLFIIC